MCSIVKSNYRSLHLSYTSPNPYEQCFLPTCILTAKPGTSPVNFTDLVVMQNPGCPEGVGTLLTQEGPCHQLKSQIMHCSEVLLTLGTRARLLTQVAQGMHLHHTGGHKRLLTVRARKWLLSRVRRPPWRWRSICLSASTCTAWACPLGGHVLLASVRTEEGARAGRGLPPWCSSLC